MIRPIEMQMIIPQANIVGIEQHHANQHAAVQSANQTLQHEKDVEHNKEVVLEQENATQSKNEQDARDKGNNEYDDIYLQKWLKRKKREEEENRQKGGDSTRVNFNVKI